MKPMRYELYADSLLLLNFTMNLYLLILVDKSTLRTATRRGLLLGAAFGAVCFFLPFLIPGEPVFKCAAGFVGGTVGMLFITFRMKDLRAFLKLFEYLLLYSFGMGGALLFLLRLLGQMGISGTGIFTVMGIGGILYLFLNKFPDAGKRENSLCRATIVCDGERVTVNALLDSGNSLTEPVSGKPVSIMDRALFQKIWHNESPGCRAIPYHSIGRSHGILQGYLLPELQLEIDGMTKRFYEVYIAVSTEQIAAGGGADSVKMIINPLLLSEKKREKPHVRQNVRKNDTEGGYTGKDAV